MPCTTLNGASAQAPDPEPSSTKQAKNCHQAEVVRVGAKMLIPRTIALASYRDGGVANQAMRTKMSATHSVQNGAEFSDGHIYIFSSGAFDIIRFWSTGQDVTVCSTWSQLEHRPFYSVEQSEIDEPADLAI